MARRLEISHRRVRTIDLFCGAGGSSWGARLAGAEIVAGFDRSPVAGLAYKANFPEASFYEGLLEQHRISGLRRQLGKIDLLLASPECTNHSPAKGNSPRCEASKDTAFQVVRFADVFKPRWVVIENVINMRNWTRYQEFLEAMGSLGYYMHEAVLDSSHFGVPQKRRRLFLTFDRQLPPSQSRRPSQYRTRLQRYLEKRGLQVLIIAHCEPSDIYGREGGSGN